MPDHALSLADAGDSLSCARGQSCLLLKPLLDFLPHTKPQEKNKIKDLANAVHHACENGFQLKANLFLLQGLNKGVLQTVSVFSLQGLLLVGGHALLTQDATTFLLLPVRGEVSPALGTEEWLHACQRTPHFTCQSTQKPLSTSFLYI